MKKEEQTLYVSPKVKTVEIKAQAIICTSTEATLGIEQGTGYTEEAW